MIGADIKDTAKHRKHRSCLYQKIDPAKIDPGFFFSNIRFTGTNKISDGRKQRSDKSQ